MVISRVLPMLNTWLLALALFDGGHNPIHVVADVGERTGLQAVAMQGDFFIVYGGIDENGLLARPTR